MLYQTKSPPDWSSATLSSWSGNRSLLRAARSRDTALSRALDAREQPVEAALEHAAIAPYLNKRLKFA